MAPDPKRVIILGSGYGGLRTALTLEPLLQRNPNWQIVLIDRNNYHQLKTEIHEVAAGKTSPEAASLPIATLIAHRKIEFTQAEITNIDFARHTVTTNREDIRYDILVIALGSEPQFFGIPGLNQYSFTLSSVEDAARINKHIQEMLREAGSETEQSKKKAMLTIVIGGAGFTGVELATELAHNKEKLARQFDSLAKEVQLIMIEAQASVLPEFSTELVKEAQQVIEKKGIRLKLRAPCILAESDAVKLKTGETIPTHTVIWTGGIQACTVASESGLEHGASGRIVVNDFLESIDHTGVYVVGDAALTVNPVTHRPLAPTAQLAIQQAKVAALNIYADIKSLKRTRYVPKVSGEFVSLGGKNAVGWIWKFNVTGFFAWFLKRITLFRYFYSIGGFKLVARRLPALFLR
jgi:NADH dehydrogenase